METSTNVETVRKMYRLFAERDNEGLRHLFAPEIEWVQMEGFPGGDRYVGVDAVFGGAFAELRENWEGWRAVVERYLAADEAVVALGFYEGTHRGTGRSLHAEFAHLVELKDGRIVRFVQYTDTFKIAEAMDLTREG
ncbi:nuclear transport factor 2 family protein [Rubrobacter radiotolerans]|uniref:Nuclear transport factor 2 family protein n=1 Tax=Rubrobacter radiotolerans TaxID=42256 RepID=A0AB35T247_RUBRA|nr:nuclear transport factor 2 family protein [Rubrobacter radiotolerans]MDX5892533.1 nuclear transport factor 2 family protein [Rubrobacter radiotolerans]SMC07824.1 hypothetical protein SAMN00767673_2684 [Rubrobacter radiotolerans DSM 5868]